MKRRKIQFQIVPLFKLMLSMASVKQNNNNNNNNNNKQTKQNKTKTTNICMYILELQKKKGLCGGVTSIVEGKDNDILCLFIPTGKFLHFCSLSSQALYENKSKEK